MKRAVRPEEFVDLKHLPESPVRLAAFDRENADPASGRSLEDGLRARTPKGELAYALAGRDGFERIRDSEERQKTATVRQSITVRKPGLLPIWDLIHIVQRADHRMPRLLIEVPNKLGIGALLQFVNRMRHSHRCILLACSWFQHGQSECRDIW